MDFRQKINGDLVRPVSAISTVIPGFGVLWTPAEELNVQVGLGFKHLTTHRESTLDSMVFRLKGFFIVCLGRWFTID